MSKPSTPKDASAPHRILVMRYRFIGDTLLAVPFLRNLRRAYPESIINVLVAPNSGEVLTHCPYINQLIVYDTTRKHQYESKTGTKPRRFWSYVSELRKQRYNKIYILKRSLSSAALAFLSGAPKRIGFNTEGRSLLLTQGVNYRKDQHEVDCFLDVLAADNIPVNDRHLEAWWSSQDDTDVEALLQQLPEKSRLSNQRHIVLHITASNTQKEWPITLWQSLARWLADQKNITIHCVGAPNDSAKYNAITEALNESKQDVFFNWCGKTDLVSSLALIARMDGLIGVDSGTLHMASAVSTPVVALLNEKNIQKWSPLGENNHIITQQSLKAIQSACHHILTSTPKTLVPTRQNQ